MSSILIILSLIYFLPIIIFLYFGINLLILEIEEDFIPKKAIFFNFFICLLMSFIPIVNYSVMVGAIKEVNNFKSFNK